jgi:hypothetical protein
MLNPARKLPTRARKETSNLVVMLLSESPGKLTPRSIATSARSMGAQILCTIQETVISMRKMEWRKLIFALQKKGGKKSNPARQNFAQLSKKLDKFEKVIKKFSANKSKKRCRDDSDSDSE